MKRAALFFSLAAVAAASHAAGFYDNDLSGKTILLDNEPASCRGMKFVVSQDETGKVRHHGCWMQHVHSIVIFWNVGRATVVPTAAVTWDDKTPPKPTSPAQGSDS